MSLIPRVLSLRFAKPNRRNEGWARSSGSRDAVGPPSMARFGMGYIMDVPNLIIILIIECVFYIFFRLIRFCKENV